MTMPSISISLPPNPLLSITKPKLPQSSPTTHNNNNNLQPPCLSLSTPSSTKKLNLFIQRRTLIWRLYASLDEASLPSDTSPIDAAQEIVANGANDPTANIVSTLLLIAFAVLSILTVGVVYLGVSDFLGKREKEKFEKEEAAKKKKSGKKKGKVRSRTGPRGFGQKINEEEEDDDVDSS